MKLPKSTFIEKQINFVFHTLYISDSRVTSSTPPFNFYNIHFQKCIGIPMKMSINTETIQHPTINRMKNYSARQPGACLHFLIILISFLYSLYTYILCTYLHETVLLNSHIYIHI